MTTNGDRPMKNNYSSASYNPAKTPVLSPTHETRWETLIKNHEVIGMQKEILHLEKKSKERQLSDWEQERLNEVRNSLAEVTH